MKKAFRKKSDNEDEEHGHAAEEPARAKLAGVKNYITPSGLQRLKDEHRFLLTRERPAVTQVVAWAASNGDRSETPTISTANGGCARLIGGFTFSRNGLMPRKWWTPKPREVGGRRRRSSSGRRFATPTPLERSEC